MKENSDNYLLIFKLKIINSFKNEIINNLDFKIRKKLYIILINDLYDIFRILTGDINENK